MYCERSISSRYLDDQTPIAPHPDGPAPNFEDMGLKIVMRAAGYPFVLLSLAFLIMRLCAHKRLHNGTKRPLDDYLCIVAWIFTTNGRILHAIRSIYVLCQGEHLCLVSPYLRVDDLGAMDFVDSHGLLRDWILVRYSGLRSIFLSVFQRQLRQRMECQPRETHPRKYGDPRTRRRHLQSSYRSCCSGDPYPSYSFTAHELEEGAWILCDLPHRYLRLGFQYLQLDRSYQSHRAQEKRRYLVAISSQSDDVSPAHLSHVE